MAGDWIPIRIDLHADPAALAIAAATGLHENTVVGALVRLWGWANANTLRGSNACVTLGALLRRYCGVTDCAPEFAAALCEAGWATEFTPENPGPEGEKQGFALAKFDTWNSQSAKRRALTARRAAAHRVTLASRSRNATSVTDALPKEEKRREEKKSNTTPQPPKGGEGGAIAVPDPLEAIPPEIDSPAFRAAWTEWLEYRRAKRKPVSRPAAAKQLAELAAVGERAAIEAIRLSIANDWQGLFPAKAGRARASLSDRGAAADSRVMGDIFEALGGADCGQ